jgi:hypothetical protein
MLVDDVRILRYAESIGAAEDGDCDGRTVFDGTVKNCITLILKGVGNIGTCGWLLDRGLSGGYFEQRTTIRRRARGGGESIGGRVLQCH